MCLRNNFSKHLKVAVQACLNMLNLIYNALVLQRPC